MPLTDLSGRPIPAASQRRSSLIERVIAVPPVRDVPNEQATEFLFSAGGVLAANGAAFVSLVDPSTGANFAQQVPANYRGRIDQIMLYCPDMVAAALAYLFASLTINQQPASAWGFVPVYPRNGVASLGFDAAVQLEPLAVLGLLGKNTDAVNTHLLAIYLHGWFWPADIQEG